jgi:hypothetical protein
MDYTAIKDYQNFKLKYRKRAYIPSEVFFFTSADLSGVEVPSGVLIYDTTNNKLRFGKGSTTTELITST